MLSRTPFAVLVLACSSTAVPAQIFQSSHTSIVGSHTYAVEPTADDGVVLCGYGFGANGEGVMLAKVNRAGSLRWTKLYGTRTSGIRGRGHRVRQTSDGGYVVAGATPTAGSQVNDAFLLRTDAEGQPLWAHLYGTPANEERAQDVVQTRDGGFLFVGFANVAGRGSEIYAVRTDATGNVVWTHTYGGPGSDTAKAVRATSRGGFVIAGSTNSSGAGGADACVLEVDAAGTVVWSQTYGGPADDGAEGLAVRPGGFYLAGSTTTLGAGRHNASLMAIDTVGNPIRWNAFGSASRDESAESVVTTPDGGAVLAGLDGTPSVAVRQGFALRADVGGSLTWAKTYGTSAAGTLLKGAALTVDGFWLAGDYLANGLGGMYVIKSNEDGTSGCDESDATFTAFTGVLTTGPGPIAGPGLGRQLPVSVAAANLQLTSTTLCSCASADSGSYGAGWPGTLGIPGLAALDRPVLGRSIALQAGNSLGAATAGILLLGMRAIDVTTPFDGALLVQIEGSLPVVVAANGLTVPLTLPTDRAFCGLSVFGQVLEVDAGASKGVSFSPGLELLLGL